MALDQPSPAVGTGDPSVGLAGSLDFTVPPLRSGRSPSPGEPALGRHRAGRGGLGLESRFIL